MKRILTTHAFERYRQRVDRSATWAVVQAELDAGELRDHPPVAMATRRYTRTDQVGYVVTARAIFPMETDRGGRAQLVAVTALERRRRSKAERRAWREQQRDEAA